MPFLQINDNQLYYEDAGSSKDVLVFAHSMLFNLRMFDDQVNVFRDSYRCVRFDFKAQGLSRIGSSGYDLDSLTEETVMILSKLGIPSCHFIGFSMGGMVGQRLAIKYPGLIKSLCLIDTSSEPEMKDLRNKLMIWVAEKFGIKILASKIMKMFFGKPFLIDKSRKEEKAYWKSQLLLNKASSIRKVTEGVLFRPSITHKLHEIKQNCLILVGKNDILTDVSVAKIMNDAIPNSILKIIPEAGHMSTVENPEYVNKQIEGFLNIQKND